MHPSYSLSNCTNPDSTNSENNITNLHTPGKYQIKNKRINGIFQKIIPLTLFYQDREGNLLRLWKTDRYGIIGSVLDSEGNLKIVPRTQIRNPLSHEQDNFLEGLENCPLQQWDLVYDTNQCVMTIWPHLIAAGLAEFKRILNKKTLQAAIRELNGEIVKLKDKETPFDHVHKTECGIRGLHNYIDFLEQEVKKNNSSDHQTLENELKGSQNLLRDVQVLYPHYNNERDPKHHWDKALVKTKTKIMEHRIEHSNLLKYRIQQGGKTSTSSENNPSYQLLRQKVQQTRLTDSYPGNSIPPKGGRGGEIGGVAASMEYIEGLFDSPESLFEREHCFCLPKLPDGKIPFTDQELRQILRELAIGIYVHGAVPWFSLHFNQNSDQFPVIHPVYENTLVGRVISMLDYMMKGYLNGGVFKEDFIDQWAQNPNWKEKSDSAVQNLIDFGELCKKELKGKDQDYLCVRQALKGCSLSDQESEISKNLTKIQTSFRIIGKQNSFKKEGRVFYIDSDFDVQYTINIYPEYQNALDSYIKKHHSIPQSHQQLILAYEEIRERIHNHMVKIPVCRTYFSMLSVINFFSNYFFTLKKHRKIPVLPVLNTTGVKGTPSLFPHLPIRTFSKEVIKCNSRQIWETLNIVSNPVREGFYKILQHYAGDPSAYSKSIFAFDKEYRLILYTEETQTLLLELQESMKEAFTNAFIKNVSSFASPSLNSFFKTNQESLKQKASSYLKELFNMLNENCGGQGWLYKAGVTRTVSSVAFNQIMEKLFTDKTTQIGETTYPIVTSITKNEISAGEDEERVVGGCSVNLKPLTLNYTSKTSRLIQNNWSKIQALNPESWSIVDDGESLGGKRALFRLSFEDVPSWVSDNYEWMESLLLIPEGENGLKIQERLKIQAAISSGNKEEFSKLIDQNPHLGELKDLYQRTLLHLAATEKDPFYLKTLLSKGMSQTKDMHGYLPLHYAAMNGEAEHLKLLIDQNTVNVRSRNGSTPLYVAILHHKQIAVPILLDGGASFTSIVGGYNPLHCALHEGDTNIINELLDRKDFISTKSINENSEEGGTPLMLACELDSLELVKRLIERGADPLFARKNGLTAIEIAINRNCLPVLDFLLSKAVPSTKAMETAAKDGSVEILKLIESKYSTIFFAFKNASHHTLLHLAIESGNVKNALWIMDKCSNLNYLKAKNKNDKSAFSLAAALGLWPILDVLSKKGLIEDHSLLLKIDYDPILDTIFNRLNLNEEKLSAYLPIAIHAGNYQAIEQLFIPKGIMIDHFKGQNGWKIAHYLAEMDAIGLFRRMLDINRDLLQPIKENDNATLAWIAAFYRSKGVLKFLLEQMKKEGISLEKHYNDCHLFHAVVDSGDVKNVAMMLEIFKEEKLVNAILNAQEIRAAHIAARQGYEEILRLLFSYGADFSIKDKLGFTPLDLLIDTQNLQAITFLLEGKPNVSVTQAALQIAMSVGNEQLLTLLITHNKSQDSSQAALKTALLIHARHGDFDLVDKFLGRLQEIDSKFLHKLEKYRFKMKNEHVEFARTFEAKIKNEQDANKIYLLIEQLPPNELIAIQSNEMMSVWGTPLQLLLRFSSGKINLFSAIERALKKEGLNPNLQDSQGNTLAHLLILNGYSPISIPNIDFTKKNHKKQTLLHLASMSDGETLQDLLSIQGINLNPPDIHFHTPVFYALRSRKDKNLKLLIDKGARIDSGDCQLRSPLIFACEIGHLTGVKILCQAGASLNRVGTFDRVTALWIALALDQDEIVQTLIMEGANCNVSSKHGIHTSHLAAKSGKSQLIRLFSAKGVSVNPRDQEGLRPLEYAILKGKLDVFSTIETELGWPIDTEVERVVKEESDDNTIQGLKKRKTKGDGFNLLHLATEKGKLDFVEHLMNKGMNVEEKTKQGQDVLTFAARNGSKHILETFYPYKLSKSIDSIRPAICGAIMHDKVEAIQSLYAKGLIDTNSYLEGKQTGLHLACRYDAMLCSQWLLLNDADPYFVCPTTGENAFEIATINSSANLLDNLLEYADPNINALYSDGKTLLHHAVGSGRLQHVILILSYQASLDIIDDKGYSPLHIAIAKGYTEIAEILLICGANTQNKNSKGKKPFDLIQENDIHTMELCKKFTLLEKDKKEKESRLHLAVKSQNSLAVLLLSHLEECDSADCNKTTPIHLAVQTAQIDPLIDLLRAGANVNCVDNSGNTPLTIACEELIAKRHQDVNLVNILIQAGANRAVKTKTGISLTELIRKNDFPKKGNLLQLLTS